VRIKGKQGGQLNQSAAADHGIDQTSAKRGDQYDEKIEGKISHAVRRSRQGDTSAYVRWIAEEKRPTVVGRLVKREPY
jgi:hypothetical protein